MHNFLNNSKKLAGYFVLSLGVLGIGSNMTPAYALWDGSSGPEIMYAGVLCKTKTPGTEHADWDLSPGETVCIAGKKGTKFTLKIAGGHKVSIDTTGASSVVFTVSEVKEH